MTRWTGTYSSNYTKDRIFEGSGYYCQMCRYEIADSQTVPSVQIVPVPKPMTKGDKVRSMSDEELADYHAWMCGCPPGRDSIFCGKIDKIGCVGCWLDWLREEATE